jgi:hypothetical protein
MHPVSMVFLYFWGKNFRNTTWIYTMMIRGINCPFFFSYYFPEIAIISVTSSNYNQHPAATANCKHIGSYKSLLILTEKGDYGCSHAQVDTA